MKSMNAEITIEKSKTKDREFNPWRTAATPAAKSLVEEVRKQLLDLEDRVSPRVRARRSVDQITFDKQVDALVADLAYEHLAHPKRRVSTTMSKQILGNQGRYGSPVLGKTYPHIVKLLTKPELGLVDRMGGSKFDWEDDGVKQTTLKADTGLVSMIQKHKLFVDDFQVVNTGEVIILRSERETFSDDKEDIQYKDTPTTDLYRTQVEKINSWLASADIEFDETLRDTFIDARDRHLVRIFNNASFEQGGRLFGGFWQNIPKTLRKQGIQINGNDVVTLDFGQIAPRIMYGMAHQEPAFEDAYLVPPYGIKYRDGVKKMFNTLLCAAQRPTRFPAGVRELFPDKAITVGQVVDAILTTHKLVAQLFFSNHGLKVMHQESQILVSILLELMDKDIIALPIHDALIVESHHQSLVTDVMVNTFKTHTGITISVATDDD